jgi:hypothetical protein
MIEQIVRSGAPIVFDHHAFARWNIPTSIGLDKSPSPPQGGVTSTNEDVHALDVQDAVQPITDQLFKAPLWWILEIFPTTYTYQNAQDKWVTTWR